MVRRRFRRQTTFPPLPKSVVKTAPPTLQTTLVFLGVTLYLGTTMFRLCVQEFNLLKQAQILEGERTVVMAQHRALNQDIAMAKTNAGVERLAREQLGLVMAQEIPVKTAALPLASAAHPATESRPNGPLSPHQAPAPMVLPPAMAALAKFFSPTW